MSTQDIFNCKTDTIIINNGSRISVDNSYQINVDDSVAKHTPTIEEIATKYHNRFLDRSIY